ncbi:spore germination protein [Paenibacillus sp. P26]|nr:spore germination protein [Paenibacillus sp. P26]
MKISGWRLFWMMATLEISMSIWLTLSPAMREAKQDAWISLLAAGIAGLSVTWLVSILCRRYSSQTLVEFNRHLFGKWLGPCISLFYFAAWYTVAAVILRIFSEFIQQTLFHNTPSWAISALMLAAMVYMNHRGSIEAIARFSELAGPPLILGIVLTLVFNVPNLRFHLLLPVYADSGIQSIVKGALTNASFLGESILLMMLTPFLGKPEASLKPALLAIIVPSVLAVVSIVMVIATFGTQLGAAFFFPYFSMVRFISFLDFIQNMDVWIIFIWIFSVFVKLSLYLFINSYGTAQLLRIRQWKSLIWFTAPVLFVLSIVPASAVSVMDYADRVWIRYVFPIHMIAFPVIMLIVGHFRSKCM